jgi:hypothetical protein
MGVVASSTHQAPSPGFLAGGRPGAHFSVLPCAPRTARLVECHCQWQCAPAVPFVVCRLCGGAPAHSQFDYSYKIRLHLVAHLASFTTTS